MLQLKVPAPFELLSFIFLREKHFSPKNNRCSFAAENLHFGAKAMTQSHAGQFSSVSTEPRRSVLLVDPHTLVRSGIRLLVNAVPGYHVIAEADSLEAALQSIERMKVDLVLTEIALQGQSGLEMLAEMRRRHADHPRIIVLSMLDSPEVIKRALGSGACCYLSKDGESEEISRGLNAAACNERYLSPSIAQYGTATVSASADGGERSGDPLKELSTREREIFHFLASGLQNNVIAKRLHISPRTVETHRARIVRKLGLASNGELIRFAIKHGLSSV